MPLVARAVWSVGVGLAGVACVARGGEVEAELELELDGPVVATTPEVVEVYELDREATVGSSLWQRKKVMSFECDWVSSKLDDGHLIFVWKQRHIIATINGRKTIIRNYCFLKTTVIYIKTWFMYRNTLRDDAALLRGGTF